jgi:hypothetical protein
MPPAVCVMPPRIVIETIAPAAQRYQTVGDWVLDPDGTLHIRVSAMPKPEYSFLVAVHELLEAWACLQRGITPAEIDAADAQALTAPYEEPGDQPWIIYHHEHDFASGIERLVAHELGVDWTQYAAAVDAADQAASR